MDRHPTIQTTTYEQPSRLEAIMDNPDATYIYLFCCLNFIFVLIFALALGKAAKNGDRMIKQAMKELPKQFNHETEEKDEEVIII